jgi:hypothetical protein
MNVFRLHIRPKGGLGNPKVSFDYCLRTQVLGMGWGVAPDTMISSWADYEAAANAVKMDIGRVRYLKHNVKPGDLLWTRCPEGHYYLGRVASEWEYLTGPESQQADITNVVRCQILPVPSVDQVPGKIVAAFRATRAIQRIWDESSRLYSQSLWNQLNSTSTYVLPTEPSGDLFSMLGSEATEDVLFLYLQLQGWLVVPNSRKADTMSYEFYLIHRQTKKRAIIQVKTGKSDLCRDDWKDRADQVFLFQSKGLYSGATHPGIECLDPQQIEKFIRSNRDLLPRSTVFWLDYAPPSLSPSPTAPLAGA